ncbi:hypothetical protein ACJDT4_13590 [Clostridium neuense]|uniref:ABC transporter permease n=1 Tax=Clostridium neuense TaxID=1728934 RepID=A0ABW8TFZ9_9CLOT
MKKLLWKDWIYEKWVILLVTFILLTSSFEMFSKYIENLKIPGGKSYVYINFGFPKYFSETDSYVSIILIIFIVFIIGFRQNLNSQQEIITAMPYSRKEIIISKWLESIICFMVPLVINFIALNIMYFTNYNKMKIYNNYTDFLMWMILGIFTYIFVITFVLFVDLFFGNKIVGAFFSGMVLFMWSTGRGILAEYLNIYGINIGYDNPNNGIYLLPYYNIFYGKDCIYRILILIIFTILFFKLMVKLNDMKNIENAQNINVYPKFSLALKLFASVVFTIIISDIVGDAFFRLNTAADNIATFIFTVLCFVILYLGIGKTVKRVDGEA